MDTLVFAISKLTAPLTDPQSLLLLATALGTVLLFFEGRAGLGRRVLVAAVGTSLVLWVVPIGSWWIQALEETFPVPEPPPRVDGIIVLGGDIDTGLARRAGPLSVGAGGMPRLLATAALTRRYPDAKLVFSGGSGRLFAPEDRDADAARPLFAALGVDPARVLYEDRSRNTHENATESFGLVQPKRDEVWLVVTSAFHMPRAIGCFRQVGWRVVAYPVDRRADPDEGVSLMRTPARRLSEFGRGFKETLGLAVYRALGRTDAFWPRP